MTPAGSVTGPVAKAEEGLIKSLSEDTGVCCFAGETGTFGVEMLPLDKKASNLANLSSHLLSNSLSCLPETNSEEPGW